MREKFTKYGQKGILILMVAALVLSSCRIYTETERKMEQEMTVRISMYNDISYTAWRTYLRGNFRMSILSGKITGTVHRI